jgi:hypothetical protein
MPVALLNPGEEAAACREMIEQVEKAFRDRENVLIGRPLERELYLQTIGAVMALRPLHAELLRTYNTRFNR